MTYKDIVRFIGRATEGLSASFYYGTVLRLNERRDIQYPVIVCAPRNSIQRDTTIDFNFVLWYVDIEQPDRHDTLDIQSDGVEALRSIGSKLEEIDIDADISSGVISVFWDRFADINAGAMCDVTFTVAESACPIDYKEFNNPKEECYDNYYNQECDNANTK